ncbi:MAG TPA: hypothetical protein VHT53_00590 [Candidatus Elarobacter sp.]|nr:hypothetical protein [Candidatus Elarobacter sp.]
MTLPAGIPGDRSPRSLLRAGTGAMILTYDLPGAWRRDNHLLRIVLADPRDVFDGGATAVKKHTYELKLGSMEGALRWRVGGEDVIVLKSTMTPAETEHLHRAMIAASRRRE